MAKIAIVGAGQAGLHLGIGLLMSGHQVTMLSNRTGEQIAAGPVISSQSRALRSSLFVARFTRSPVIAR